MLAAYAGLTRSGMLAQARKRPDIEWILGDLASVPWDGEFDLVVMTGHPFLPSRCSLRTMSCAFETRNPLARSWEAWTPENAVKTSGAEGEKGLPG